MNLVTVEQVTTTYVFLNREASAEHTHKRLTLLNDNRYQNVLHALFEEAHEQANGNIYTIVLEVTEQAGMNAFFT